MEDALQHASVRCVLYVRSNFSTASSRRTCSAISSSIRALIRWRTLCTACSLMANAAASSDTVEPRMLRSRSDFSIYEGQRLTGWPTHVVRRGRVLLRDGEFVAERGGGRFLGRAAMAASGATGHAA